MARGAQAFVDIEMIGDATGVEYMLKHLERCFSPIGMTDFFNNDVTPYLRERAKQRFEGEGDDAVGQWAPLKETTRWIRANGRNRGEWPDISPAHPINVRTHDMETYITQGRGDVLVTGASASLFYPQRRTPTRKGLDRKVRRAQTGGGNTVPRPVLGVSLTDLNFIVTKLAFFIQRGPNGV